MIFEEKNLRHIMLYQTVIRPQIKNVSNTKRAVITLHVPQGKSWTSQEEKILELAANSFHLLIKFEINYIKLKFKQ